MGTVVATIEARMTSSRLPWKVLMTAGGKPMLQILIERLRRSTRIDEIVMATTVNREDDPISDLCGAVGIRCYRGSEPNVLERVCEAARFAGADVIAEITGDCPLLDPALIDDAIAVYLAEAPHTTRYVTNSGGPTSLPWGFDVHVFAAEDLYAVLADDPDDLDIENVSYRFYRPESGDRYSPRFVTYTGELARPELRFVLDYDEDYRLLKAAYEDLNRVDERFGAIELIRWADAHPDLRDAPIARRRQATPSALEQQIYDFQMARDPGKGA